MFLYIHYTIIIYIKFTSSFKSTNDFDTYFVSVANKSLLLGDFNKSVFIFNIVSEVEPSVFYIYFLDLYV